MNGRFRPMSAISPRRSTVTVDEALRGISASLVSGAAGGLWFCARATAATAVMAAPVKSVRRATFVDVFRIAVPQTSDFRLQTYSYFPGLLKNQLHSQLSHARIERGG